MYKNMKNCNDLERLRQVHRYLSMEELARRFGVSINTVYRWIKGRAKLRGIYAKVLHRGINRIEKEVFWKD